jgi:hypothetical protein
MLYMSSNAVIFCHVWKPELLDGPLPPKKYLNLLDTPYTPSCFPEKAVLWSPLEYTIFHRWRLRAHSAYWSRFVI